ncbi:2-hydroxychromene-2-carboxylate isomerase [Streptomyces boninensis]|uniref:2-hydroxychromene-2-carboxylate isomerase n=1 Tax=Streptomyces boninensis TaxID=2039455 RepID=UPI003B226FBD
MAVRAASPRFYFSLRSPYNFLALHDLRRDHPGLLEQLTWRPFWEPDETGAKLLAEVGGEFPYVPMSRAKQFYILHDVRRLAAERGLKMTWPVDREPWWEPAHLTWFLAERAGLGVEWVDRAGQARWIEGRDICDPDVVAELAAEVGLDVDEVRAAPDDPGVRAEATRALLDIHRDGVFGVPYFVSGRKPFWGLDRVPAFAAELAGGKSPVAAEPKAAVFAGATSDLAHAGGCG